MQRFPLTAAPDIQLHLLEQEHAPALFALVQRDRAYLRTWQNWPDSIDTLADMQRMIDRLLDKRRDRDGLDLVITVRGQPVGKIGLVYIQWQAKRTEFGYWLAEPMQGRGVMTQSCEALIAYVFRVLALDVVQIRCAVGNVRSRAIPERLGFTCEGVLKEKAWLRGAFIDEVLFSLSAAQWGQRTRP